MKNFLKIVAIITALIIVIILWSILFTDFWKIDKCLDLGGGWNRETRQCEGSKYIDENLKPRT